MFIEIDGAKICVEKQGQGPALLLIHGVPDCADMWHDVIAALSDRYTCYAIDLPGFHRSEIPKNYQYNIEAYGHFINQVVETLGIQEPLSLMLHDWGGIFGMSFACLYPEKVKQIAGGSFTFSDEYRWHFWARVWRMPLLGEIAMLTMSKALFKWEIKRGSPNIPDQHLEQTFARYNNWATKQVVLRLYRSADPKALTPFRAKLQHLTKRIDIDLAWGKGDPYVNYKYAELIYPRKTELVENCGHWIPIEAPERLAALLP